MAVDTGGTRAAGRGRWLYRTALDVILAAAAGFVDVLLFSYQMSRAGAGRAPTAVVYAYGLLGGAFLIWRRRAPVVVFGLLWLHSVGAAVALPSLRFFPLLCLLVGLHSVAAYRTAIPAGAALVATLVPEGLSVADSARNSPDPARTALVGAIASLAFAFTAWGTGRLVAVHRARARRVAEQHQAATRKAVAVERMHIARELHDSVAGSVTVIVLHAAGAAKMLQSRPGRAAEALNDIEHAGRQAMEELRRLLTVLRANEAAADSSVSAAKQPSIDDLDSLLDRVRAAGLPATLHRTGEPGSVAPSVSHTAYRIVQEALTNVTKHAPHSPRVDVELTWTGGHLILEVSNDHPADLAPVEPALSCGYGLIGLRERAALVGGQLTAGSTLTGFKVTAVLPVSDPSTVAMSVPGAAAPPEEGR